MEERCNAFKYSCGIGKKLILFKPSPRIHLWMFGRELDSSTCAIKVGGTEPFTGVSVLIFEFRRLEWDKLPYVHNDKTETRRQILA